jgi:hypothetical protein
MTAAQYRAAILLAGTLLASSAHAAPVCLTPDQVPEPCEARRVSAPLAAHTGITREGDAIYVRGTIERDDHLRFADLASDDVKTIFLNSSGGYVHAAIAIGTLIRQKHYTTMVAPGTRCDSACVLIWASGVPRQLGPGARLGVHCSRLEGSSECNETGNDRMVQYLHDMGMPAIVVQTQAASGMIARAIPSDGANSGE